MENNIAYSADKTVKAAFVTIDPTKAEQWLEKNKHNRNLSHKKVAEYVRDMEGKRWASTGETIKFSSEGALLDGQHRLQAIVRTGVTVEALVVMGLQAESQNNMDLGYRRDVAQQRGLKGEKYATMKASVARIAIKREMSSALRGGATPTPPEVNTWLNGHEEEVHAAALETQKFAVDAVDRSLQAYATYEMRKISPEDATEFWKAAHSFVGMGEGDPVATMLNWFMRGKMTRQRYSQEEKLSVIFRAWNRRRRGQTWNHVKVSGALGEIPELV